MFERFTDRARRAVTLAQEEARLFGHNYIATEHLLLGVLGEGQGVAAQALAALGISAESVRREIEAMIGRGQGQSGHVPFTPRAKQALEFALRESLQYGDNYIGTEHLLLGLIRDQQAVAAQILIRLGTDPHTVRQQVLAILTEHNTTHVRHHGGTAIDKTIAELQQEIRRIWAVLRAHGIESDDHQLDDDG